MDSNDLMPNESCAPYAVEKGENSSDKKKRNLSVLSFKTLIIKETNTSSPFVFKFSMKGKLDTETTLSPVM